MNLVIKEIYLDEMTDEPMPDLFEFSVPICVEIGEKDKQGSERFHFVAASPTGLQGEVSDGEFKLLRGYILMKKFDLDIVRKSVENLIDHARSRESWNEVLSFFNRYGIYDSEDLDRTHFP
jgi:hypothetical protein